MRQIHICECTCDYCVYFLYLTNIFGFATNTYVNVFVTSVCDNRWKWAGEAAVSDVCLRQQGRVEHIYILIQVMLHICIFIFVFFCINLYFIFVIKKISRGGWNIYVLIQAMPHNCICIYIYVFVFVLYLYCSCI